MDHTEGINIREVISAMKTELKLFRHALQLYHKFQREKPNGNENRRLRKVTFYCHAVYNRKLQHITTICNIKQKDSARRKFYEDVIVRAQKKMHG
jgi:hypothetical protein